MQINKIRFQMLSYPKFNPKTNVVEKNNLDSVSFTAYRHILKEYFKAGMMPGVKYGLYGEELTPENVSLEHIVSHNKGGKTHLSNLALASAEINNSRRRRKSITCHTNEQLVRQYLEQFKGLTIDGDNGRFDGDDYIKQVSVTLRELGLVA